MEVSFLLAAFMVLGGANGGSKASRVSPSDDPDGLQYQPTRSTHWYHSDMIVMRVTNCSLIGFGACSARGNSFMVIEAQSNDLRVLGPRVDLTTVV